MFRTPRKGPMPGGRSAPGSSSREPRRGLFENGQWFCDCEPRLPAIHLKVKKKNKNHGRWFYTCQRGQKEQCTFFMFEDVAQAREKEYLFDGGREREAAAIQTHIGSSSPPLPASYASRQLSAGGSGEFSLPSLSTGDEMDFMSAADEESLKRWGESEIKEEEEVGEGGGVEEARPSAKRKRRLSVYDSDEDEFGGGGVGGGLNSDEEREMVALAESATQSQSTQRRESQQTGQFSTPSAQRTHDVLNGLPTPNTDTTVGRNSLLIATEQRGLEAKRRKMDLPATPLQMRTGSSRSSSSVRQQSQASVSGAGADDYPITEEVMALLGGVPTLDDDVAGSVRRKLNAYALRMRGVERGRDMVRSTVQARDARIAELQARVAQLEKERGADRERIKTLASLIKDMS